MEPKHGPRHVAGVEKHVAVEVQTNCRPGMTMRQGVLQEIYHSLCSWRAQKHSGNEDVIRGGVFLTEWYQSPRVLNLSFVVPRKY